MDLPKTHEICFARPRPLGSSRTRIIVSGDEAALIRLSHEQTVQMKCRKCLVVPMRDTRQTHSQAAKSSRAQAPDLRPDGRYSRSRHGQRHTTANFAAFRTLIRRFMRACAIPRQRLYARYSEHTSDQGNRVLGCRVAAHLDVRNRVSMQTGRLGQIPNPHLAQRGPSEFVPSLGHRNRAVARCDKVTPMVITSPNQGGIQ